MPKTVTIDFWDVQDVQAQPFNLSPVLESIESLDPVARMKRRDAAHVDYLAEVQVGATTVSGTAVRIRVEDWPERINMRTGTLRNLDLPENEALGEEMSFHFDRNLQVLATQRHPLFRASALVDLLRDLSDSPEFDIQPKLRADAWDRFRRWSKIASVEIKVRGPVHDPQVSAEIPAMTRFLDAATGELNAATVELSLSVGRFRNQSLAREKIRRVIARFRRGQANVVGLVTKGSRADGPSEMVDFIRDRLVYSGEVPYSEKHLDREKCRQLLKDAVLRHRGYLASLVD